MANTVKDSGKTFRSFVSGLGLNASFAPIKRRIEINQIDTGIRELVPSPQPDQIVAELQPVH